MKPNMILKGGLVVQSLMGDANASIPTPQPVLYRPMYAAMGKAKYKSSITFVSKAAYEDGVHKKLGLQKLVLPVHGIRSLTKKDMKLNDATPEIKVDPETYEVRVDGEHLTCEPVDVVPMGQRYFLF